MPPEESSIRYTDFRQAVRRFPPSAFLPALAKHTAQLDPLIRPPGTKNANRWPWAASAMARESVLYSNEHRHGGTPSESDFNRLYNLFNESDDSKDEPSLSDIRTPLVYEQFAYGESDFEELSRVWALYGDPSLGTPIPWEEVFGMSLAETVRATFVLHGWVAVNGGQLDRSLFDAPHMQEVFERIVPRAQLMGLADHFTATVDEARALHDAVVPVPKHLQRFAFNPFVVRPLIDLGAAGVWAPQTMLVSRAIFPSNLYYVDMKQWGKMFADNLGDRVEQYVGRQLRLVGEDHVEGEIEYAKGQTSVDWFWVTDQAVFLVECKSARMTLGAKAADDTLGDVVARSIGKARAQIDRTAGFIRDGHSAFAHLPNDRPIIGMIVTAEPVYLGNASILHEYGEAGATDSQVVSLRELEYFVTLEDVEAADLLLSVAADPEKRTWALSSVKRELRQLPKNPILEHAWHQFAYIDARGPAVAPAHDE